MYRSVPSWKGIRKHFGDSNNQNVPLIVNFVALCELHNRDPRVCLLGLQIYVYKACRTVAVCPITASVFSCLSRLLNMGSWSINIYASSHINVDLKAICLCSVQPCENSRL